MSYEDRMDAESDLRAEAMSDGEKNVLQEWFIFLKDILDDHMGYNDIKSQLWQKIFEINKRLLKS